jgi:hypothetical protein
LPRDAAFPAALFGPVERRALRRLAAICAVLAMTIPFPGGFTAER